jgi:hypothetical protein
MAHDGDVTTIVVGQVVKSGNFAGPQSIVHDMDGWMHMYVDKDSGNRVIVMKKHRFGPAGMPLEMALTGHGLELRAAPHLREEDPQGRLSASDRRAQVAAVIERELLAGMSISGYCFERLQVDVSGNFWRVMLIRAAEKLRREGYDVKEKKIGGRMHTYVEGAPFKTGDDDDEDPAL